MKLQQVTLKNFRGIREPVSLVLKNGQSLLLYGDNRTGKSSFADAIEWFITGDVSHLDGEEIEKHGGLRNALSKIEDECCVEVDIAPGRKGKKILNYQKGKLKSEFVDQSSVDLATILQTERILIRNKDLISFICATKTNRLIEISQIIGFDDVVNTKDTFKKAVNNLKIMQKAKGFENQIANKKGLILQKLQAAVHTREQLFSAVNSRLKAFNLGFEVQDRDSFAKALGSLKTGTDQKELALKSTLELCSKGINEDYSKLIVLDQQLKDLVSEIIDLQQDQENVKQISLAHFLDEAEKILGFHEKDECPLCQQQINRETLLSLIKERISALKQIQNKLKAIQDHKSILLNLLRDIYHGLKSQLKELQELSIVDLNLQPLFDHLNSIERIGEELNKKVLHIDCEQLHLNQDYQKMFEELKNSITKITQTKADDNSEQKVDLFASISVSEIAFDEIEKLEKEKAIIEEQRTTLDRILSDFVSVQRDEMKSFLRIITDHVNEYFLFMNDGEQVNAIELSTVDDSDGEFVGISIQFMFHGQLVSSPKKFLSESYLNCLGLCIFLASIKLFNKQSKFFILDDVISSFDKAHRTRFGQLLIEKFSDYQILVLTHESEWFDFMANTVKGNGWGIIQTRWNTEEGTSLELPTKELKEQIDSRFHDSDVGGLGNLLRRYAERMFKELCVSLDAEVKFRFNDLNERRLLDELYSSLRGRLKDKSDLSTGLVINRLSTSKFFTNQASHDSSYQENIHDMKAVYGDLVRFDDLFRCSKCNQRVSINNLNRARRTIFCKCGDKEISWKE